MDLANFLIGFSAFVGGVFVFSRVIAWVALLVLSFEGSGPVERRAPAGLSLAPLVLHSGPWSLAIAIGTIYYVATLAQPAWLWTVLSGVGLAIALQSSVVAFAYVRQRRKAPAPAPLTPERLRKIRHRFVWGTSLYFGGSLAAGLLYQMWPYFGRSLGLVAFVIVVCFGGGYLFAWVMWQWYGSLLETSERDRQRRERENAV